MYNTNRSLSRLSTLQDQHMFALSLQEVSLILIKLVQLLIKVTMFSAAKYYQRFVIVLYNLCCCGYL